VMKLETVNEKTSKKTSEQRNPFLMLDDSDSEKE
jgi:hypothetical protein